MKSFPVGRAPGEPIEVASGEVRCAGYGETLTVSALGSCVAVTVVDPSRNLGGIAHIMLPGRAREKTPPSDRLRYAEDAIEFLVKTLSERGAGREEVRVVLVGAGNVLRREDDRICISNMAAAREIETKWKLKIVAECLGGLERKRVRLDLGRGVVTCGVGDGRDAVIWDFANHPSPQGPAVVHRAQEQAKCDHE